MPAEPEKKPNSERLNKINSTIASPMCASVPLSLHPAMLENHGQTLVDSPGSGPTIDAYSAGRSALQALYNSATAINNTHASMLTPQPVVGAVYAKGSTPVMRMEVAPERAPELASAMAQSATRAAAIVERQSSVVDGAIEKLDRFIAEKTRHPRAETASVVAEASAIREYVAKLKPEQRMTFLHDAAQRKELDIVAAVLNASPFVSGIDREQHANLRMYANDAFAGVETAQRAALVDIKKKIATAMQTYAGEYHKRLPRVAESAASRNLASLRSGAAA